MARMLSDKLKDNANLRMSNTLELKDFKLDILGTLGEIKFLMLQRESREVDSDTGELLGEIKDRRYMLVSMQQGTDFVVIIPPKIPLKEFNGGVDVKLINPKIESYAVDRYTTGFRVLADDIVLLGADNKEQKDKNIQQPQNQDKK